MSQILRIKLFLLALRILLSPRPPSLARIHTHYKRISTKHKSKHYTVCQFNKVLFEEFFTNVLQFLKSNIAQVSSKNTRNFSDQIPRYFQILQVTTNAWFEFSAKAV